MPPGGASSRIYGSKAPTRKQRMARAVHFVCFCAPERRAALTPDDLVKFAGITSDQAQKLLNEVGGAS